MKQWPLKTKTFLLILVPTVFIALLLGGYFTYLRFNDLNRSLEQSGTSILRQMLPSSRYGLLKNNTQILQGLVNAVSANPELLATIIFNKSGEIIAYHGPDYLMPKNLQDYRNKMHSNKNISYFIQAINEHTFNITQTSKQSLEQTDHVIGWVAIDLTNYAILSKKLQALFIFLIITVLGILIAAIIARVFSNNIIGPILKLKKQVHRYNKGNYEIPERQFKTRELAELNQGINQLVNELVSMNNDFHNNVETATDDLKQTLETMEVQNIELDMAYKEALNRDKVKSEFIANLSHEIRTPMSSIIGFANLLLETNLSTFQRDYLQTIQKSANNLLSIINDILDFSKIEAGKLTLDNVPLDIADCVDDTLSILAPSAHAKKLELVALQDYSIPNKILGDPVRLKQILTNLVNNALKFTSKGNVTLITKLEEETHDSIKVCITVKDTGIGLSQDEQQLLFKAFNQADISITRKFGGTGLGLVICKRLIHQMGGEIYLESELGKGTSFWFTLTGKKLTNLPVIQEDNKILAGKHAIIYEPHAASAKALQNILEQANIKMTMVQSLRDLQQAITKSKQLNMPIHYFLVASHDFEKEKVRLQQLITAVHNSDPCHIIALSNSSEQSVLNEFADFGINKYLTKPVVSKKLFNEMCSLEKQPSRRPRFQIMPQPSVLDKLKTITVLIADDNLANLKLLESLLVKINCNVKSVPSGLNAIEEAKKSVFDLIFLDFQMPICNGMETAIQIRKFCNKNANTPIIIVSAHISEEDRDLILNSGVNQCLLKPVDLNILETIIHKWVPKTRGPEEKKAQEAHIQAQPAIFDWQQLLHNTASNKDLAKEMIELFIKELPSQLDKIRNGIEKNNHELLLNAVHQLHGASGYCAVPRLKMTLAEFEQNIKKNDINSYLSLLDQLEHEIKMLMQTLKDQDIAINE